MATCNTSLEICQSVELQRRLLLGDYNPKLEDVLMSEFVETLGYNVHAADKLLLTNDCGPNVFSCCVELMRPAVINAVQNAQEHGSQDTPVRVHFSFDGKFICTAITNGAGRNHATMQYLQAERGTNFLL